MSNITALRNRLDAIGYQAWSPAGDRIERVSDAVTRALRERRVRRHSSRTVFVDELRGLRKSVRSDLARMQRILPMYGAIACGGPNSGVDVPNGELRAINALLRS